MESRAKRKRPVVNYREDSSDDQDDQDDQDERPVAPANNDDSDDGRGKRIKKQLKLKPKRQRRPCPEPQPFPLLQLPFELRILIYKACFDQANGHYWLAEMETKKGTKVFLNGLSASDAETPAPRYGANGRRTSPQSRKPRPRSVIVSVLQLNKQVHNEAMDTLYGHSFKFRDGNGLQLFLARLTPDTISRLRHIDFRHDECRHKRVAVSLSVALSMLAPAINIKSLRVPSVHSLPAPAHARRPAFESFDYGINPVSSGTQLSVQDWDVLVGKNMAQEVYRQVPLFVTNFLRTATDRANYSPSMSPAIELVNVLRVFETAFEYGPRSVPGRSVYPYYTLNKDKHTVDCLMFGNSCVQVPRAPTFLATKWTDDRRHAVREAMAEELSRLEREG